MEFYGTLAALHMVQAAELRKRAKETGLTVLLRAVRCIAQAPSTLLTKCL